MAASRGRKRFSRSTAKAPSRKNQRSRAPEIVGVASLGAAIFLGLGMLSLQLGDGRLMGPFGRSCAVLLYSLVGIGGYAVATGLGTVAVRVLMGRDKVVRAPIALGVALGVVSVCTLVHLAAHGYRVAGHPPGGALGGNIAEMMRSLVSTAGTALLSLVGLLLAVVMATPLELRQVLSAIGRACRWVGLGLARGARRSAGDMASFTGEVIRAVLPERDRDEYAEDDDDGAVEETDPAAHYSVPIIDRSGRLVAEELPAGDTEKMDDGVVPALVAEDGTEIATAKKKGSRKRKMTEKGVGTTVAPDTVVMDTASPPAETPPPSGDGPVIVESQFRHPKKEEMKAKEEKADAARLGFIPLGDGDFQLPPVNLLDYDETQAVSIDRAAMLEMSAKLIQTLENYGIQGQVTAIRPGPVVTMYEFAPAPGTRLNKIVNLADDLAMSLEALKVRIVAPIPGKAAVGIEVPNRTRETVYLKEILADDAFQQSKAKLPLAIGKDIEGGPIVVDLAKMPHLLVAGATGSGKSVAVNTFITSLLYSCTPEDVRFIMVDPKVLELSIYEGVPHLLLPVVTDPKKANLALRWAVEEMERRYELLARMGVRDIATYNKKLAKMVARQEADKLIAAADAAGDEAEDAEQLDVYIDEDTPRKLPFIVVVIDEFADLMMCAPKEVETSVARIAQKARAAGIHLLLATQRPSVDVITGLIKANFPSRMAFHVTSKVDSRTILDQMGAENLLGAGDMLFSDRGSAPARFHGCFVQEEEIGRVVDFIKKQGRPAYNMDILKPRDEDGDGDFAEGTGTGDDDISDDLYDRAVKIVAETQRVSVSYIQRRLSVGYNRAAKMVERMEKEGVVSPPDVKKVREVLISPAA
ncbi:MAG TPA: DNA translocase FtsK 4TM domain-containing protein [Kofleriaceae bacterium]|nr:DNA translocase FtsK 4TM domain-containing protein [Kofleriaceae bacterium]